MNGPTGNPGGAGVSAPPSAPGGPGTSLRGANISHELRAVTKGRLGSRRALIGFVLALAMIIGVGVAIVAIVAPSTKPLCQPYRPCGRPVVLPKPLVNQTVWRSSLYGFTLEYPGDQLQIASQDGAGVALGAQLKDGTSAIIILHGQPASQGSPSQAITQELGLIGIGSLAADTNPADAVLGGGVGHQAGAGGAFVGTLASPQGIDVNEGIASEAATNGNLTIVATAIAVTSDAGPQGAPYQLADAVINSVRWPGSS